MAACTYDPLQLAERQSAETAALLRGGQLGDELQQARAALKCLEWIEYAEESMIKAENDCLVEYSEEMHCKLHGLYADWLRQLDDVLRTEALTAGEGPENADLLLSILAGKQRVQEWLAAQADIARYTLSQADLGALAAAANLSAGNRSPHGTP